MLFQEYFQLGNFLTSTSYFRVSVFGMFWQRLPSPVAETPRAQPPGLPPAGQAVGEWDRPRSMAGTAREGWKVRGDSRRGPWRWPKASARLPQGGWVATPFQPSLRTGSEALQASGNGTGRH